MTDTKNPASENNGDSPLHGAASSGDVKLMAELLNTGAEMEARNNDGWTPLSCASGHPDAVRFLIEKGADVKARDKTSDTPLHVAAYRGDIESMALLLERGADIVASDDLQRTPLEAAFLGRHPAAILYLYDYMGKTVPDLLEAELIRLGLDGENPNILLRGASFHGDIEIMTLMLLAGAKIDACDEEGRTAIDAAMLGNQPEAAKYLLRRGVEKFGFSFPGDILFVGPKCMAVGMKMDLTILDKIVANEQVDISAWPRVTVKGDHEYGRWLRKAALEKGIPVCKLNPTVLHAIFDEIAIGEDILIEQVHDVVFAAQTNVMDDFMISPRRCRTRKGAAMNRQRLILKGHMYKVFIESKDRLMGHDPFILFLHPNDEQAIDFAAGYAKLESGLVGVYRDCPEYTFPFHLFRVNADGVDCLVHQFKPKVLRPPWKVYVLIGNRKNFNNACAFYAPDDESAIEDVRLHVRTTLVKSQHCDQVPEDYIPWPYQIFHDGKMIYEYSPSPTIDVNCEYFNENAYWR